jgi:hypothetical protein
VTLRVNARRFAIAMLKEFDEVTLKRDLDVRGVHLSAGARGMVMAVYADGTGYEVEFHQPAPVVLTPTRWRPYDPRPHRHP